MEKTLVIGLNKIKQATNSVGWLEPIPLISNYHKIYIVLPTLTDVIFKKIIDKDNNFFKKLKKDIFEALRAGLTIYCITSPLINYKGISNYDLLPFDISRNDVKVETFKEEKILPGSYLSKVESTDGYFEPRVTNYYLNENTTDTSTIRFLWKIVPFLQTLHYKNIAFKVVFVVETFKYSHMFKESNWQKIPNIGGEIIFLPPLNKGPFEEGVKILLKNDSQEISQKEPEWFKETILPGEKDLESLITKLKEDQEEIIKQREQKEIDLRKLQSFKWLLSFQGKSLEKIVDKAFEFIGIELQKGKKAEEDRWLIIGENKIPIEIKGHEGSIKYDDIRQIVDRTFNAKNSVGKTEGILIANCYCNTNPKDRADSFSDGSDRIKDKATDTKVALLDTKTLLEFVKRKIDGEDVKDEIIKKLTQMIGVIK